MYHRFFYSLLQVVNLKKISWKTVSKEIISINVDNIQRDFLIHTNQEKLLQFLSVQKIVLQFLAEHDQLHKYIFVSLTEDGEYGEILEITRTLEEYTPSLEHLVELEEAALRIVHVLGYCNIVENLIFHVAQVVEET